jgi:hypothetical protein
MRVAVVVLAAFVTLYVAVTVVGLRRHASEPSATPSTRPSLPGSLGDAWPLAPPFLKVGASDVSGQTLLDQTFVVPPGVRTTLRVKAATQWYQPRRLMRLVYLNALPASSVPLSYPPIAAPPQTDPPATPDPLTFKSQRQIIVLPQSGGVVELTCLSLSACTLSL